MTPPSPHRGQPYNFRISRLWKSVPVLAAAALIGCSRPEPAAVPELPDDQDLALSAALSTNRIRIGDPVTLTLTAIHRSGSSIAFPSVADGKNVVVRESDVTHADFPGGLRKTEQTTLFTSLAVTNHIIGRNGTILMTSPAGVQTNPVPFVALEVASSLAPGETDLRPAKGDLARWPAPPSRGFWIGLGLLALLAAAVLVLRRILAIPRTILHMAPALPPHQTALDALAALRAKGWIETRRIEPFYVELSAIVRRYLEGRFGLRAPERTTEEFIRDAADSRALSDAQRDGVARFLEQSDLVKFARHSPEAADMRNALGSAERLVRETMPVIPAAPSADAPAGASAGAHPTGGASC